MSCYTYSIPLENLEDDEVSARLEIAVGWDECLETYFAQVVEVRYPISDSDEGGLPTAESVVRSHWKRALEADTWGEELAGGASSKEPVRLWRLIAGLKRSEISDLETVKALVAPWAPLPLEIVWNLTEEMSSRLLVEGLKGRHLP